MSSVESKPLRVALGSLFTESNSFVDGFVDRSWFERTELLFDEEVLSSKEGMISGMIAALQELKVEIVPLISASCVSGPPLNLACYLFLKSELLDRLRSAGEIDGVLLALHGSALVHEIGDLEGDLLAAIRAEVGESKPIVSGLDLHAHVTEQMVRNADALLAFETYPHTDAARTGQRAARLLYSTIRGETHPTMALAKVPVMVSGVNGETAGAGPFAEMMRLAKALETDGTVLSASVFLVHPYLDVPGMGGGALVITNGDLTTAKSMAAELAAKYWTYRFRLEPNVYRPEDAIRFALETEGGPVLLVETADCCGGGAAGDSVYSLRALVTAGTSESSLVPVVDPEAAEKCWQAGVGSHIQLELGHKQDTKWGQPLTIDVSVLRLGDGSFSYRGGIWGGVSTTMGPSALVQAGSIQVLIMSKPTYEWGDEQFRTFGLEPKDAKFVVAKNPMNYRVGYPYAKAVLLLDTPGPTPATMKHTRYRKLQRPYYPADQDIAGLTPALYSR